jgi:hypothetical protein
MANSKVVEKADPIQFCIILTNYLNAFSTIEGIILVRRGQESYKQGLVFISMSQG